MRMRDPFRQAGFWFNVSDYQFRLECLCGADQQLDACTMDDRDGITVYVCRQCGVAIAGVTQDERIAPGQAVAGLGTPDDHDGHRMCGFVFGAKVDMELWQPAADDPFMDIPRRPGFFTSRGLE
jgi:hypothetical protein